MLGNVRWRVRLEDVISSKSSVANCVLLARRGSGVGDVWRVLLGLDFRDW